MLKRIVFIHDGLAFYPSMLASKKFFSDRGYHVEEIRRHELQQSHDFSDAVVWLMMGFYPQRPVASCAGLIHEYRSQSTGNFRGLRDLLKRYINHKPSYRLFQSERIQHLFDRNDGVPSGLLPLGVPKEIVDFRAIEKVPLEFDFCYIGSISEERRISEMLDGFIATYGANKTFVLVGDIRDKIDERYRDFTNIIFTGRLPQADAFSYVNRSKYSVCFFPSHPPHCFQPPTKLYEYAALGRKIIANDSPSNISEISRLGISAYIMKGSSFPSDQELLSLTDNSTFDPSPLFFDNAIVSSGVVDFVEKCFSH